MQSAKRVAALESYIGLVEVGVGLLPAGGGLKEAAIRAHHAVNAFGNTNYLDAIKFSFENAAMAKVSGSAKEAQAMNYLKSDDIIVANVFELLSQAKQQVQALAYAGYRPPLPHLIAVGGRSVAATLKGQVINLRDGGFISEHDAFIAGRIADVITGGDIDMGTLVTEEWLLKLERQAFVELMSHPKTMERIVSLLQTGKPLRN
jgi:3-hydroxyacyl-CoA dehydrogenase